MNDKNYENYWYYGYWEKVVIVYWQLLGHFLNLVQVLQYGICVKHTSRQLSLSIC